MARLVFSFKTCEDHAQLWILRRIVRHNISFVASNFRAIRTRHNRHLLDTCTHWSAWNVPHVSFLVHVLSHGNLEQSTSFQYVTGLRGVFLPCESMTIYWSFHVPVKNSISTINVA